MIEECTALILAGGQSRRMGRDKASLDLGGRRLLQRAIDLVEPLFPHVLISVRERRDDMALPQVIDPPHAAGPLAGLCAGLEAAATPWVFALATDMPFVTPALIEALAQRRSGCRAVAATVDGFVQPMAAFYSAECLEPARALLAGAGRHSLRALLDAVLACRVEAMDSAAFFDLDTPEDWAAAQARC